jgi:signal transduction histidine kinase
MNAEERLGAHAAELERTNLRLREANHRLETALAFKNDLTSMLTHDVAQPISSIASLAELLSADWSDLPEDVRHELAVKIDKNTRRLIKMLGDLQLLFRLDTGAVTARRTPVPLLEVVENTAAELVDDGGIALAWTQSCPRWPIGRTSPWCAAPAAERAGLRRSAGRAVGRPARDVLELVVEDRGPACRRSSSRTSSGGSCAAPAWAVHRPASGRGERRLGALRACRAARRPHDRHP